MQNHVIRLGLYIFFYGQSSLHNALPVAKHLHAVFFIGVSCGACSSMVAITFAFQVPER